MNRNIIYLGLFLVVLLSCDTDDNDLNVDIISEKWKVVKAKSSEEVSYTYASENYILDFLNDKFYEINLDVNKCTGAYKTMNNGEIVIDRAVCTKACCDSEFAEDLKLLLPRMKKYYRNNDELVLEGEGKIILEKF